eukprot:scaffold14529_cov117-Isochrysis_galbana.AAC.13
MYNVCTPPPQPAWLRCCAHTAAAPELRAAALRRWPMVVRPALTSGQHGSTYFFVTYTRAATTLRPLLRLDCIRPCRRWQPLRRRRICPSPAPPRLMRCGFLPR